MTAGYWSHEETRLFWMKEFFLVAELAAHAATRDAPIRLKFYPSQRLADGYSRRFWLNQRIFVTLFPVVALRIL
ncbi:hypothetical protein GCM10023156_35770 [Novipirellula rosea]|uniref:Uncharacterized protein n=1 Tax=Novipirellula rosea TaxID=1031540 RepID=A0ABP8MZX3_9BACT